MGPVLLIGNGQIEREICFEQAELRKARADIAAGRRRLRNQERLIVSLKAHGRPTAEAERLAALFRETLSQWRQHRDLITGRLAYLKARIGRARQA